MKKKGKKWEKPKLVVLVRGKPEEAVLFGCKYDSISGPAAEQSQCWGSFEPWESGQEGCQWDCGMPAGECQYFKVS